MSLSTYLDNVRPCFGLMVGPGLWCVSTQLGLLWPHLECGRSNGAAAAFCLAFAAASALAGFASGTAGRHMPASDAVAYPRSLPFVSGVAALTGLIFAYVLLLQGAADLLLDACQR